VLQCHASVWAFKIPVKKSKGSSLLRCRGGLWCPMQPLSALQPSRKTRSKGTKANGLEATEKENQENDNPETRETRAREPRAEDQKAI